MATVTSYTSAHIDALLGTKADSSALTSGLATKADSSALTSGLAAKADLVSGKVPDAQIGSNIARIDSVFINVQNHGVVGDGTTDDTTAIQAVLNSAVAGATVFFPKTYATTAPIYIPPQIRILGTHGAHIDQLTNPTFKPKSTFTGTAVIMIVDQATGSYTGLSLEQRIEDLTLDLSNISSASSVDAIQAQGNVHGVYIKDVGIYKPPNHGINTASNGSGVPASWRVVRVHVNTPYGIGINATITDSTWTDCEVINGASHGWYIGGSANTVFDSCRSEWNANDGFNFGSGTGTGAGSGGPIFTGCSTDRNAHNGVSIPTAANGNAPVTFNGCMFRRDGSGSTSSGYSAVNVNASTQPIILNGCTSYPGTDDSGSGNASPQYGLSATSANVTINGGIWHAISEGVHDGGSNVKLARNVNLFERTGTTSSPVDATRGVQTTGSNGASLYVPGYLSGLPSPALHGAIAWTDDPLRANQSPTLTAGALYLSAVYVAQTITATKLYWRVSAGATTPTASSNWVGLYDSTGARLANVNIDSKVTTQGQYVETISAALKPGLYWIAWVLNAASMPQLRGSTGGISTDAATMNFGLVAANMRFANNSSGWTSLPAPLTVSNNVASAFSLWGAIA